MSPLKQWRSWVLVMLLVGPVLAYVGLGMIWLWERGWVACTVAAVLWLAAGGAFSLLASRWTKTTRPLMPPLDWDAPQTFSPRDRDAWKLVEDEADHGEKLSFDVLLGGDVYIETGRRLLGRLADHYHPFTANPLDDVPVVELLTAFELAAEDLAGLGRQVPGGDLIAPAHWRRAVQVAGYINKANDLYSFVLPFLNPVTGLTRLSTREWIVKPAWKSMQHNLLRWFYQAYVNRLGMHLIELLSGRLAIGASQYRRLTRRPHATLSTGPDQDLKPLSIVVAGARGAGKSRLIAMIQQACSGEMNLIKARVVGLGLEPALLDRMKEARWIESSGYPVSTAAESRRDRASRQAALTAAAECDLLVLVVDGCQRDHSTDVAFAHGWDRWFQEHLQHEVPPALVVVTGVDRPEFGGDWKRHSERSSVPPIQESLHRAQFDALRALLPPTFHEFVAVGLGDETCFGVIEHVVPTLAPLLLKAERTALIRRLHEVAGRSKVGRLVSQLGQHGRSLWGSLKARHHAGTPPR
ncbi:MAG: GTPase [Isosphaerales bacterium]